MQHAQQNSTGNKIIKIIFAAINRLEFFGVDNIIVMAGYFVMKTVITLSMIVAFSNTTEIGEPFNATLRKVNHYLFVQANDLFRTYDAEYELTLIFSLLVFFLLVVITALSSSLPLKVINFSNRDGNKISIIRRIIFLILTFSLPISYFFSYSASKSLQVRRYDLTILSIINLLGVIACTWIAQEFSNQIDLKKYNLLARIYNSKYSTYAIGKVIIAICQGIMNHRNIFNTPLLEFGFLAIIFLELKSIFCINKYINKLTETFFKAEIVLEASYSLLYFILVRSYSHFKLFNGNFLIAVVILFLLGFISLKVYKAAKTNSLNTMKDSDSEDQAVAYILELIKLITQQQHETLKINIILAHRLKCDNISCFCTQTMALSLPSQSQNLSLMKKLILNEIQHQKECFKNSFRVISLYLGYKLSYMSYFSKVQKELSGFLAQNNHTSLINRFLIHQITDKVDEQVNDINLKSEKLKLEYIFEEENIKFRLIKLLNEINECQIVKYRLLTHEIYNLNMIEDICYAINDKMREIEKIRAIFSKTNSYNIEIYQILLFYIQCVLKSKQQSQQLTAQTILKMQILRHLKGVKRQNLEKHLYTKNSCIIESSMEEPIGLIRNVTHSCQELFEVSKSKLLDKEVHFLMPSFFINGHKERMVKWLTNQSFSSQLSGLLECYYVTHGHKVFSGVIHLKLMTDGRILKIYVLIVKDNDKDYLLLNDQGEIQGIGERLLSQNLFNLSHIDKNLAKFIKRDLAQEITGKNELKRKINITRRLVIQPDMNIKIIGSNEIPQNDFSQQIIYQCDILMRRHFIGSTKYFTLKFFEIKKIIEKQTNFCVIAKSLHTIQYHPIGDYKDIVGKINIKKSEKDQFYQSIEMQASDEHAHLYKNATTLSSQSIIENGTVLKNMKMKLKDALINPLNIKEETQKHMIICLAILFALSLGCCWSLNTTNQRGIESFIKMMEGDQIMNNNIQVMQIIYNNILASQIYCSESIYQKRCKYLLKSNDFLIHYFYDLFVKSIKSYQLNRTVFSRIPYGENMINIVEIRLAQSIYSISTYQFIEHYYHSLRLAHSLIERGQSSSQETQQSINFLINNWATIKLIDHQVQNFYQETGDKQLKMLQVLILSLLGAFCIFIGLASYQFWQYVSLREVKKKAILNIHTWINRKTANKQKVHYEQIRSMLKISNFKVKKIKSEGSESGKHNGETIYESKRHFSLLSMFFLVSLLILMSLEVIKMMETHKLMESSVLMNKKLIESSKIQLENYFQFKTYFYSVKKDYQTELLFDLNQLQNNEINFIAESKNSIRIFDSYDSNFSSDFNNILLRNICQDTYFFEGWQQKYCRNGTHFNFLQKNVNIGINTMQRKTLSAYMSLIKNKGIGSKYIEQQIFEDLDDYSVFMFRTFQLLQIRIMEAFNSILDSYQPTFTVLNSVIGITLIVILIGLIAARSNQKQAIGNLYGVIFQLPEEVLQNKNVVKILRENLKEIL